MNPNEIRAHEKKFGHTEALYYESETQGPTLYEKLNPTVDQIKSFLLVPIKNPTTGKRSGLRGNRKTKVASLAATASTKPWYSGDFSFCWLCLI